ncbi:MAG: peptidylprolyl isomerase [Pseudomonadota bacterium]
MSQAKDGDTVKVHYTGTLDDGRQFDSSAGGDPLEFTLGARQVIAGFESAVTGMTVGDTKTVSIEAEDAYGNHNPAMVQTVGRDRFPANVDVAVGMQFQASGQDGQPLAVTVVEVTDDQVTVDANHALAGQRLTFALELVEIA